MSDDRPKQVCIRCLGDHDVMTCGHVKAVDLDADGKIKRLEFLTPADYAPKTAAPAPGADDDGGDYPRLGQGVNDAQGGKGHGA